MHRMTTSLQSGAISGRGVNTLLTDNAITISFQITGHAGGAEVGAQDTFLLELVTTSLGILQISRGAISNVSNEIF